MTDVLRVLRGNPKPNELAALVAVLAARGGDEEPPAPSRSRWADRSSLLRSPLPSGPGAWRASGLPR